MTEIGHARLISQLKRDEGRRPRPYQDSRGRWTVGYGHCLETGPPLSETAMEQILEDDIADAETRCARWPWFGGLSEARQGVILAMAFNLGLGGLGEFRKMFGAIVMGQWEQAAVEMLDSDWAQQVGARAHRLAEQMRNDRWT